MTSRLSIIGLGPGPDRWLTPAASEEIQAATVVFGYQRYVDRLPDVPGQTKHASDNREELERAREALRCAAKGAHVAVVSGGDPGVFAMASAVCEAIDTGEPAWRTIEIVVEPGITAMLAAAAKVGAPLGHDFCTISLSDNLKPWPLIEKRIRFACEADMAIAFYNPASKSRREQIRQTFELLRQYRTADTPVVVAKAIGRPDEDVTIVCLEKADPDTIDMRTLLIVGASNTRMIERAPLPPLVYTERFARES